ncbi:hypothetical protein Poli38472_009922 [Pythium oligandrum]|uniref:RRM domain-containing protein n=1 Tax=Pythium oligandrum TaxID=41045 RepID=A0A8K1FH33_PYTOL|nr:hypothetical protein Poli38472_009922 [Pythium oligandrum]|eukprot:TMW58363.1 hypothetical protein Poli38472_009922 [Pythium oligandrum]
MATAKRSLDARSSCNDESTEDSNAQRKRSRRSRWESDGGKATTTKTSPPEPKNSLSEIVKRLSGVVKEKSTPQQLQANLSATTQVDAAAAKARALAQASVLALGLPTLQVTQADIAKRVYVGNLYYELKENDIRNWFSPFGSINSIDLSMEPGVGRSKGFCFIEYEDVLAAESAVQVLNGSILGNRALKVGRPHRGNLSDGVNIGKEAIKNVSTNCIYVGGVRLELNSHQLKSIFSPFGEIQACVMTASSPLEPGTHRGYGFLEFADVSSAMNAIQHMNGFDFAGQKLQVGKASPSAMTINLAISTDKVAQGGEFLTAAALDTNRKRTAIVEDPDVDAVKDVADNDAQEKRCLCLLNLVKIGEVDEELQDEVRSECSRFGDVEKVDIQELQSHVRVFVVFKHEDSASKAKKALHGRFFGGNQVQAHFYSLTELGSRCYSSAFL